MGAEPDKGQPGQPISVIGVRGPRIRLVPLDAQQHLENYVRWFNDPDVTRYLLAYLPMSRAAEAAFFEEIVKSNDRVVWAVHDEEDRHIGGTGLHSINWKDRSATSGIIIGAKEVWGKGYGREVMQVRTKWAFEELGLHRVESECYADNIGSARCLAAAGYRQVGVARKKHWRNGRWHDSILWEILDEDYFSRRDGRQQAGGWSGEGVA